MTLTWGELLERLKDFPPDPEFADDLERIHRMLNVPIAWPSDLIKDLAP